jgi:hypothetical protein
MTVVSITNTYADPAGGSSLPPSHAHGAGGPRIICGPRDPGTARGSHADSPCSYEVDGRNGLPADTKKTYIWQGYLAWLPQTAHPPLTTARRTHMSCTSLSPQPPAVGRWLFNAVPIPSKACGLLAGHSFTFWNPHLPPVYKVAHAGDIRALAPFST